ncbi:MAG: PLP-dependent lyase/thiolase [Byssovorax sp.]
MPTSTLRCTGCGAEPPDLRAAPYPFRCARAHPGDDIDHRIERAFHPGDLRFPGGDEPNPFLRFRALSHAYQVGVENGLGDEDFTAIVDRLDRAIARVDGRGFRVTPFARAARLSEALGFTGEGGVWVKDETGNVSGTHKARHLMGIALYLQVIEALGLAPRERPPLAIASCGNAALAAAIVARAAGRALEVFVPPDAAPSVLHRLGALGAQVTLCPREPGMLGDPCVHRFREAIAAGALPFCCQGSDNGLTIDGGETLGFEILAAQAGQPFDRVFLQVGGGALGTSCIQAYEEARALGRVVALPRFHAVQTAAVAPLARAWDAFRDRLGDDDGPPSRARALAHVAEHRSSYMWPWEEEPKSVAHGIIDDETYDFRPLLRGMAESGGTPVLAGEALLVEANVLGRDTTGIDVDETGSSGLAGLLALLREHPEVRREKVAVVFSGVRRSASPSP